MKLLRNDDAKAARAAALVQALAHPVRLRLLAALCEEAAGAAELAAKLGLPRATVARHLRALAAARLVAASGPPRTATWRVAEPAVHGLVACMEECARGGGRPLRPARPTGRGAARPRSPWR